MKLAAWVPQAASSSSVMWLLRPPSPPFNHTLYCVADGWRSQRSVTVSYVAAAVSPVGTVSVTPRTVLDQINASGVSFSIRSRIAAVAAS